MKLIDILINLMIFALMLIAGYVFYHLAAGHGPKWVAITLYWLVLLLKNAADLYKSLKVK